MSNIKYLAGFDTTGYEKINQVDSEGIPKITAGGKNKLQESTLAVGIADCEKSWMTDGGRSRKKKS